MPNDARNKLRSMGGIMASSPELMQVAQGYQAGGPVMTRPQLPQPDSVTVPGVGAPVVGLGRVQPMQPGRPVVDRVPEVGVSYRQMVEAATVPSQADLDARFQASQKRAEVFPETDSRFTSLPPEYPVVPLAGEQLGIPERTPSPHPEYTGPVANETDRAVADFLGDYVIDPSFSAAEGIGRLIERAAPAKPSAAEVAAAQEREPGTTPAPLRPVYDNPVFMENLLPPGAEEPSRAETIKKRAEEELSKDAETTAPQPDTGGSDTGAGTGTGGGAGGPGPRTPRREPTKKDLRSRYKEKIELFKEIYGEDDEDRARDKAMSLAMLGLAIASGQSPDALTNIAQGAMAGVQGMSEQEQARREREQGLQTLALETAIGEMDAEREAQARAAEQKAEFQNRLDVARIRADGKGPGMNRIESAADLLAIERELVPQEIDKGVFIPEKGREQESTQEYINQNVLRSLNLYKAQNLIDDQVYNNVLKTLGVEGTSGGASQANPALQARITEDLKTKSPEQIKAALRAQGIDPSPYEGL